MENFKEILTDAWDNTLVRWAFLGSVLMSAPFYVLSRVMIAL